MEKEVRKLQHEVRNDNGRHISGYAIVFNSQSENLGFFETIERGALDYDTLQESDVFALLNHDENKVLARAKYGVGNLMLTIDEKGLRYDFDAMHTPLGDEVLEYVRNGVIDASSFAFTIADGGEQWERRSDGNAYRTITKIDRLFDVSPVFSPAYSATSCSCRSYENFKKEEERKEKYAKIIEEIKAL